MTRKAGKIRVFNEGVTLIGGAPVSSQIVEEALSFAPILIAADGGANHISETPLIPSAIIGDLDSLESAAKWRDRIGEDLIHLAEQESTDFEKCLAHVEAPFFIAVGFLGGRQDHGLAALHALIADPRPIILVGEDDVAFAAHSETCLSLPVGERISLFPLVKVRAVGGEGLKYPVAGLELEAGRQIGTSNEAAAPTQSFSVDRSGVVVFLNPNRLPDALRACGALFQPPI